MDDTGAILGALVGFGAMGIGGIIAVIASLLSIALCVFLIICNFKIFAKMGEPWWKALIPFYNTWVLFEHMTEKNIMWFIFLFIPFLNIASTFFWIFRLPMVFGYGAGMGILNLFFPYIAMPIIAFGKSEYQGPGL